MSKPPDDNWEARFSPAESNWCLRQLFREASKKDEDGNDFYSCVDSLRAARAWKSSDIRRFKRIRSCCGSMEWVAFRWNWSKLRFDKFILGFNFGH
jgi:hypothetical protein